MRLSGWYFTYTLAAIIMVEGNLAETEENPWSFTGSGFELTVIAFSDSWVISLSWHANHICNGDPTKWRGSHSSTVKYQIHILAKVHSQARGDNPLITSHYTFLCIHRIYDLNGKYNFTFVNISIRPRFSIVLRMYSPSLGTWQTSGFNEISI